jgi:RNA polymerase sigma-70 factor, ECF subfamily
MFYLRRTVLNLRVTVLFQLNFQSGANKTRAGQFTAMCRSGMGVGPLVALATPLCRVRAAIVDMPRRIPMESMGYIQDCSLVREAQGGSQTAFEQLVHTYDQTVLRLALRLTGSASDAQDIHQETFLKVYKKLDGFRFECSFGTWIYRIVTNICLDHLRRNRARKRNGAIEITDDELLNRLSDDRPGNNPEQELLDRELGAHILRALQRLTPRERLVFDLRHFEGLKLQRVSEILDASEGSIKMTFFRATRKLRSELGKYTKRHRSSLKQNSDNGANQAKLFEATTRLSGTLNTSNSAMRLATPDPIRDRILVIESNHALQETVRHLFCSEGYEVDLVPDGAAGLELLRFSRPSAVIVDIQHAGRSESDLCRQMSELIPGLPIVVLTARAEVSEKVLLLEAGADDYVTIPFSSRELVARLKAVIRRASRVEVDKEYLKKAGCL